MDQLNRKIVDALTQDARTPFLEISKRLGVSEGTIRNRVGKLLKHGAIRRFTVELGDAGGVSGVVCIKSDSHKGTTQVGEALKRLSSQVGRVFEVSGEFDLICIVDSPSVGEMNFLLERIRRSKGVLQTQTFMVMNRL